jgi:hypothetical protein
MPVGAPLPENQPESEADPIDALRLKLEYFKEQLLLTRKHSDWYLPKLPWNKDDLRELPVLIHAVYMADHKLKGTTGGKELRWVDGHYKRLGLLKTVRAMISAVPSRPVAVIQSELVKIDPSYNPAHLRISHREEAIARHKALQISDRRYRALVKLSAALGEPKNPITNVLVDDFAEELRELCPDTFRKLKKGFALHEGQRFQRLISQTLFLELQRQELLWRLACWDQVDALAGWIDALHDEEVTALLSGVAVHVPETPEEYLARRERKATQKRVAKHRTKRSSSSE